MRNDNLISLVERAKAGDKNAFEEIVREKSKDILFFCLTLEKNRQDAEDISQEAILAMWKGIKKLKSPEAFHAWMYRIVRNTAFKSIAKKKITTVEFDETSEEMAEYTKTDEDFIPDEYVMNQERNKEIYDIVMELPRKRREAVLLHYYSDVSIAEIAGITDQTEATVRGTLWKARRSIKEKIMKMQGVFVAASLPSQTNLGKILHINADNAVSADMIDTVCNNAHITVNAATFVTLGLKKIIAVIAGLLVTTAGVMGVIYYNHTVNTPEVTKTVVAPASQETAPLVPPDSKGIKIDFAGACKCGHINPNVATLNMGKDASDVKSVTWQVLSFESKTEKIAGSGTGTDAAAGIAKLEKAKHYGKYMLKYTMTFNNGYVIDADRDFEIVSEKDLAKLQPE